MSLLLRKECQPVLDEHGLGEYHAAIVGADGWEKFKVLGIVGTCGQEFVKIRGIAFSKINPSAKEIEYAAELLQEFFLTHRKTLEVFLDTQRKYALMKRSNNTLKDADGWSTSLSGNSVLSVSYGDKYENLIFTPTNRLWQYGTRHDTALKDIGRLSRDKVIRAALKKRAKDAQDYCNARKAFTDAKSALLNCEI